MSNEVLEVLTVVVALVQFAAVVWVLVRRRGMWPVLLVNLLLAAGVLVLVVPYLPQEFAYICAGEASGLFDYMTSFSICLINDV